MKKWLKVLVLLFVGWFVVVLGIMVLTALMQPSTEEIRRDYRSRSLADAVCKTDPYAGPTVEMVAGFIDKGGDVNQRVPDYPHPPMALIEKAARCGHVDIVRLLIRRGASPAEAGLRGVVMSGNEAMARMLVDEGAGLGPQQSRQYPGMGPELLPYAVLGAQPWLIQRLLEDGANVQIVSPNGSGLLVLAFASRHTSNADRTEIVRRLLAAGAHVNALTEGERQPLVFAADRNNLDVVEMLLAHGARINASMPKGWLDEGNPWEAERKVTALAIAAENCHVEMVELLLRKGASTPPPDLSGQLAAHVCNRSGNISKPEDYSRILTLLTRGKPEAAGTAG